jgi:hypothetical protein
VSGYLIFNDNVDTDTDGAFSQPNLSIGRRGMTKLG